MPKSHDYESEEEVARRQEMGRRIEAARQKLGLQKQEFAQKLGVAASTYSAWISGRHSMSNENMNRLVKATGESSSFFNPEALGKRDTLEWLAKELGTRLGKARIQRLLDIPESRLRKEIDAIWGAYLLEQDVSGQRRN